MAFTPQYSTRFALILHWPSQSCLPCASFSVQHLTVCVYNYYLCKDGPCQSCISENFDFHYPLCFKMAKRFSMYRLMH